MNQRLLPRNEYLTARNRVLRSHLPTRLRLYGPEHTTLAGIGKRLARKVLQLVDGCSAEDAKIPQTVGSRNAGALWPDGGLSMGVGRNRAAGEAAYTAARIQRLIAGLGIKLVP